MPVIIPPLYKALINTKLPFEIIICDDCSSDNSIEYIKNNFPEIKLICNEVNQGYSPTINKGIIKASYDYVFLLNNDVSVSEDYFIPQLRYFEREDTFGVMGRIIGWNNDEIQDGAKYPYFHGVKIKTNGNYVLQQPKREDWLYSVYLSGANAFVDRKKLLLLNGFDETFAPFYVEDYELSIRAWRLGWKCYYEHFSVCRHMTSVTIKKKSSKKFIKRIYNRNKMFLHAIHLSKRHFTIWNIQLFFELLYNALTGKTYYIKSFMDYRKSINLVKKSKERLIENSQKTGTLLPTETVFTLIKNSLNELSIKKF